MRRKHAKMLEALFAHPTPANIQWRDIEASLKELGAKMEEREGSWVGAELSARFECSTVRTLLSVPTRAQ